ncbi:hypothetical protein NE556_23375, partial [[Clostridium] symbiosum]|nr:hypothetical protein [[Clostridium] symbiosum]
RVLLAYPLAGPVGVDGIWAAIPIGWILADAAGVIYYRSHRESILPSLPGSCEEQPYQAGARDPIHHPSGKII